MHNFDISKLDNLHQHYQLTVIGTSFDSSVLKFVSQETLCEPFEYSIEFTSSHKDINPSEVLNNQANFCIFERFNLSKMRLNAFGETEMTVVPARKLYGVITQFERLSVSEDEAHYRVMLKPHIALLDNALNSAIYQNMSVMEVVAHILKSHTSIYLQFKDKTTRTYPKRDFHCQWQESDLAFIKRITAEVGIWFRFEMDERIHQEVIIFADENTQLVFGPSLPYVSPSSLSANGSESVWDITTEHAVIPQLSRHKSYAYQAPSDTLLAEGIVVPEAPERYGEPYHYDEHYEELGARLGDSETESGRFYAKLQHERYLNEQNKVIGRSSSHTLKPGDMLDIQIQSENILPKVVNEGIIITRVLSVPVGRDRSFEVLFEAVPYSEAYAYRPKRLAKPTISGTIPAHISSRTSEDKYAWLDEHGRYRVKFNFDLNTSWKKGFESLWVRLAKPYSGETYGFHFPLIDGTEVAIAFVQGDPDRPYIAYAMHNFEKTDHVTKDNHTRNVIRTPANNKLRMEDKRGAEHLKLNTEYGKTQLNLGHLVNNHREKRGEGFELRTDEWGAIRAGKGIYISSEEQSKSEGHVLDMQSAINQLETALSIAKSLASASEMAKNHPADIETHQALNTRLTQLTEPGIIANAPEGMSLLSPKMVHIGSSEENIALSAGKNADISVLKRFTVAAGDAISLFAQKMGVKLFANKGKVEIQAQNDALEMASRKDMKISSIDGSVIVSAEKELILNCQGAYIKLSGGNVEIGAPKDILLRSNSVQIMEKNEMNLVKQVLAPIQELIGIYSVSFKLVDKEQKKPIANRDYAIKTDNGELLIGKTDGEGNTMRLDRTHEYNVKPIFFPQTEISITKK